MDLQYRAENWLVTLQKIDTEKKSQYLSIKIFFKWELPARKYHIYSITKFMANILTDKRLFSEFPFERRLKNHG